ncbi:glycosyltransferase [Streptosporangium sp. NPDC000396]|uniref:glycosyltransferase n=1 Tax=Streptosporangium sp. NPDC000396 TaxID=3366185 RepID=UPI003682BCA4
MKASVVRVDPVRRPQPLIRLNDFGCVSPPELGAWTPNRTVSVVIPAFQCGETLSLTLASLAAQSYPAHLLEVVVVDDGSRPALRLPEITPERTRIVSSRPGGWGRAWACQSGADVAEGEVIHWLDADMIVFREHLEAQMRWHHLADYIATLGRLKMVPSWDGSLSPAEVHAAVTAGTAEELFDAGAGAADTWSRDYITRTRDLREAGLNAFRVHVGASASVPAALLKNAGGLDTSLVLAEDTELGYRLAQAGAVFVAEGESRSWHLGPSTVMRRENEVKRHNWVFLANRIPSYRSLRRNSVRQWEVPYVEVVVPAGDAPYEQIRSTVDGFLRGSVSDIRVTVVGPWSLLSSGRRSPLDDPGIDLRLIKELYSHDSRVDLVETVEKTPFPVPFRFTCPPGWVPRATCLQRLTKRADEAGYGLISLALAEGDGLIAARLERTAAFNRARMLEGDRHLDDVVEATFGTQWLDGKTWGLDPMEEQLDRLVKTERWKKKALRRKKKALRWRRRARRLQGQLDRTPMRRLRRAIGRRALGRRVLRKGLLLVGVTRNRRRSRNRRRRSRS